MPVRTELRLRVPNSPGALRDVVHALAVGGVGVLALSLEPTGELRLIVDHVSRAEGLLRERHRTVTAHDVLVVTTASDRHAVPAALALIADAGVNVDYAYTANHGPGGGMLVLGVVEPLRVATATGT